jgi:hypothetical protein
MRGDLSKAYRRLRYCTRDLDVLRTSYKLSHYFENIQAAEMLSRSGGSVAERIGLRHTLRPTQTTSKKLRDWPHPSIYDAYPGDRAGVKGTLFQERTEGLT